MVPRPSGTQSRIPHRGPHEVNVPVVLSWILGSEHQFTAPRVVELSVLPGEDGHHRTLAFVRRRHVFRAAVSEPEWLDGTLAIDDHRFLLTGPDLILHQPSAWHLDRPPSWLETSSPEIFAAGDMSVYIEFQELTSNV